MRIVPRLFCLSFPCHWLWHAERLRDMNSTAAELQASLLIIR
jgi:hypothetical protein